MTARTEEASPRVLWITSIRGTEGSVRPDAALAAGLVAAGVELRVIAPAGSWAAAAFAQTGAHVVGSPPRRWFGRRATRWLREGCIGDGIEVVHLLDRLAALMALPAMRGLPPAVVLRHERTGGAQRWNPLARLTVLHSGVDHVICTCDAARAELARRRDPETVSTLRPGHRLDWYAGPAADLESLGVPRDAIPVAVLGNYRPRKGIEYVIEAAQWLPLDTPAHFLLIGSGIETRSVLERIVRSPLRERFHLLGHRADAPGIAAACRIVVRGAVAREGIPQTVIEAMACGVPPILTDTGGARELVIPGESGIIVRPRSPRAMGEALAWLLDHPGERRAMGVAARARIAEHFSFDRALDQHLQLYRILRTRRFQAPS